MSDSKFAAGDEVRVITKGSIFEHQIGTVVEVSTALVGLKFDHIEHVHGVLWFGLNEVAKVVDAKKAAGGEAGK